MKLDNGSIIALLAVFFYMLFALLFASYSYIERYASGIGMPLEEVEDEGVSKVKPQYMIYNQKYL